MVVVQITGSALFHAPSPVERQNRGVWIFSLPLFSSPAGGDIHSDLQKTEEDNKHNSTTKSNPPSSHESYFISGFYILPRWRRLRLRVEDVEFNTKTNINIQNFWDDSKKYQKWCNYIKNIFLVIFFSKNTLIKDKKLGSNKHDANIHS